MANKVTIPTKVITGVNTRWSYANVWEDVYKRQLLSHRKSRHGILLRNGSLIFRFCQFNIIT